MSDVSSVVVIGGGHGGGEVAVALSQSGWAGKVIMVSEEKYLPYHRPPLSKAYLTGDATLESLYLKPAAAYEKAGAEVRLATRVMAIDRAAKVVTLSDGAVLPYSKLVIATGGRPRPLVAEGLAAGAPQPANLHYLRTIDDVERIHKQFLHGLRLVIVGGGYIGLEVAAVARKRGLSVTVLEAMPRVLARVTAPEVSAFYQRVHGEAGVDVRTSAVVQRVVMDASGDAVQALVTADGAEIPADLVIVGIGLIPNVELAQAIGLAIDNGIVVDEFAQTSDPDIYAVGDVTNHPNGFYGRRIRLESVPNALEQARAAAAAIAGKPKAYSSVPWFWSDQYDLKLQMVGLSQGYDQVVVRGSTEGRSFTAFYLKEGCVISADVVARPQEFMLAKRIVAERMVIPADRLADDSTPLKAIVDSIVA